MLPSDTPDQLQGNTRSHPLALPPPHRPDLEDLLHEQVVRTAVDTAVSLRDAAEAHEQPLMRLRRDVGVVLGQRRIAYQQQCLLLIAGDECSLTVADVEAAHLDRLPARYKKTGDHREADSARQSSPTDPSVQQIHSSAPLARSCPQRRRAR